MASEGGSDLEAIGAGVGHLDRPFHPTPLPPHLTRSPTEATSASPPSLDERRRSSEYSRVLSKMFRVRVAHGSKLLLGAWRAKGGATWKPSELQSATSTCSTRSSPPPPSCPTASPWRTSRRPR